MFSVGLDRHQQSQLRGRTPISIPTIHFQVQAVGFREGMFRQREGGGVGVKCHGFQVSSDRLTFVLGSKLPLFPYNRGWSSTQQ